MTQCRKCRLGPMSVHILSNGYCQGCVSELSWKNADYVIRQQREKAQRIAMYEKGKKIINKKWKEKYGDASLEEVLGN